MNVAVPLYTTKFQAGLGVVSETRLLLETYKPGMTVTDLNQAVLNSGLFPSISARRLRNLIRECFAPRYLVEDGAPALHLKTLAKLIDNRAFLQILHLFTSRSQPMYRDFLATVYWQACSDGRLSIGNEDASRFLVRALDDGYMVKRWNESTVQRVSSYLIGCCSDYGLLEPGARRIRRILPYGILPPVMVYLAYDLHFRGMGDNSVLSHEDWGLYGLDRDGTLDELKRVSRDGHFIVQSAGDAVRIAWKYANIEETCRAIVGR